MVISDIGGISDIVSDGQTGYLCKPGDTTAFAARLDALVSNVDLRNQMAAAARARAVQMFDASACAHRLGDLMAQAILQREALPHAA